ncbi:MAG: hypothetical protein JNK82_36960 [Myxococcaceae bacterium]|nr:hypothetical protein [Myxococcaceae bacterium]
MNPSEKRLSAIQAASRNHPLVHFALDQLEDDEDTLAPRDALGPSLINKLREIDEPDVLLAAVLGLFDLAYVLQEKQNAFEAGEVILAALEQLSPKIEKASQGLPAARGVAQALKARKKDEFGGKASAAPQPTPAAAHLGNAGFDLTAPRQKKR